METAFAWTKRSLDGSRPTLVLMACCLAAISSVSTQADDVLLSEADIRIVSVEEGGESGFSVSGAGDVNGDGLADFIIGAPLADARSGILIRPDSGRAFVVFGQTDDPVVVLDDLDQGGGFIIEGPTEDANAGDSVSGVGDVNGDGYDDLLLGASGQGASYLVYGKPNATSVDLREVDSDEFILFEYESQRSSHSSDPDNGLFGLDGMSSSIGESVSGVGDFNGDGIQDFIFGGSVALIVLGGDLTRIEIEPGGEVSGAGDVNGDGRDDVLVGESIVFGRISTAPIDRSQLGSGGFNIIDDALGNTLGASVAGAGDVNGDGFADVILGDPTIEVTAQGSAVVIFGGTSDDDLDRDALGNRGFQIGGPDLNSKGTAVAAAGDTNGDGLSDILVGAPRHPPKEFQFKHGGYWLSGQSTGTDLVIPFDSTYYQGVEFSDRAGYSLSGAGDINGDGVPDIVIGAFRADPVAMIANSGESFVVFSDASLPPFARYGTRVRNGATALRPVGSNGDGSNVSHPDAHAWIGFSDGAAPEPGELASEVTVQLYRNDIFAPQSVTPHAWFFSTERVDWSQAQLKFRYFQGDLPEGFDEQGLRLFFAPAESGTDGPFSQLPAEFDHDRNLVTTSVDQLGFFFIGQLPEDALFSDRFEE